MKKITTIFFLVLCINAKSQVGFEEYYSEKYLLANLQKAKDVSEQLDCSGILAVNYKRVFKDSLAAIYLAKAYKIAADSKDVKLMARAIWWDNRYDGDTIKVIKHLRYAQQNNLKSDEVIAYINLTDYYIHDNLALAEKNGLNAKNLLESWKADSVTKDSLKVEVFGVLAHAYIHKKDGVNTSRYLLPLLDYARQDRNELLKILAMTIVAQMYSEWDGQGKKSTEWWIKVYEYYKKRNKKNELLQTVWLLANRVFQDGNKVQAELYYKEAEKLMDSLKAYGYFQKYIFSNELGAELITAQQYFELLDNHFNGHLYLPLTEVALEKAAIYDYFLNKMDSTKHYLRQYRNLEGEKSFESNLYMNVLSDYYLKTKQYDSLIWISLKRLAIGEQENNMILQLGANWKLADAYLGKKDYKNAYKYSTNAYNMENDMENLSNKDEVGLMQMQKQQEVMEEVLSEQKKAQEAEQKRIRLQSQVKTYGFLAGIFILVVIAGILWRNNRRKQKDKQKIEQAYDNLKATQQQLVQSEKMASLGELTAGIAHEIQNPLNFVNNFSEVNDELLKELKAEAEKGNLEEVKAIAKDIEFNSEKINHHGKRADAIVKGMLQHSRASSGQKEPTDINALCDEYLRLAYHGLRAKDKSFNATIKTDFDETIGNINIIPQDVGRVILNLINNAFYVVDEKLRQAQLESHYAPTVSVSTKKTGAKVLISVKDNGNGIPQKVLDKIFQPFFTTKPTGQGTGLGLSLSYDIVKAHGGELKVETKEGEGTTFIIQLPKGEI
jgi:signal transduction histidine kinase